MEVIAARSRTAARSLAASSLEARNHALGCVSDELLAEKDRILAANELDKAEASKSGDCASLLKRLGLSDAKFDGLIVGLAEVRKNEDPIGKVTLKTEITPGLVLERVTCPIGVLAVIFEARPEAGVQIASLCLKSGNSLILKGGKEAKHSNEAIANAIRQGLKKANAKHPEITEDILQLIEAREEVSSLLKLDTMIDLVIPRGSNQLVQHIKATTKIPVLGHADGICATYIDEHCDMAKAVKIVVDEKTDYPAACNAVETVLVHEKIAEKFLAELAIATAKYPVKFRADKRSQPFLPEDRTTPSEESDFRREFLDYEMAVKVVVSVEEAIEHINSHGSHHTDSIVTEDTCAANKFRQSVDSSGVYWNASTRFADGFKYGFGAEVGISTNRIHSRGPVGVEGLVLYKYLLSGTANTSGEMGTPGHEYTHRKLI